MEETLKALFLAFGIGDVDLLMFYAVEKAKPMSGAFCCTS